MSTPEVLALVGVILAMPAAWFTTVRHFRERARASFEKIETYAQNNQHQLRASSWADSPLAWRSDQVQMLAQPEWILSTPLPIQSIAIELIPQHDLTREGSRARHGKGYSAILAAQRGPGLFNGFVYRLLGVDSNSGQLALRFTGGSYFDYLDESEYLAHELASRLCAGNSRPTRGRLRRSYRDPFDFSRRATSLGINTLTVRRDPSSGLAAFYMHRRVGKYIVNESGLIHVIPAGEFAPGSQTLEARADDFDLFRNICREYAEEFLNLPEAFGQSGRNLDFARSPSLAGLT